MSANDRPLSPHLQVYRWELSMVLSILHRLTGIALTLGLVVLTGWLSAAAADAATFAGLQGAFGSPTGKFALGAWAFALFLHVGNGVRHLAWDIGWGFSLRAAHWSGIAVIAFAVAATAVTWSAAA